LPPGQAPPPLLQQGTPLPQPRPSTSTSFYHGLNQVQDIAAVQDQEPINVDDELSMVDQILKEIGNSPSRQLNINNSQEVSSHTSQQFQFHGCNVNIYNK
jgi:hypothetical protein